VRKADSLPPSCVVVTESGNLNFLKPSGPLRACNGTALPFLLFCCFREYEESEAIETVHEALIQGVNYIDTAPWYGQGRSEELLGKVMVSPFSDCS